ncbi:type IV secretory system conjugative DNA transfer family protein [Acidithiobacillus sp. M4-SHS-6]|uniref:type IV secretory system conjugative DNA transfer family protein n=1 Tax=Acidithiobacillus sp. M4-SHS-6 TaxID=3383024 RepID=UPI0039BE7EED
MSLISTLQNKNNRGSYKKLPIRGHLDALSLAGLGAGVLTASPMFGGMPLVAGAGALASLFGGGLMGYPRGALKHSLLDAKSREGFILESDAPYSDEGLLVGYTKDKGLPIRIPWSRVMYHLGFIGSSGFGKTTVGMYALAQQMALGGGFIFIDAKIDVDTRDTLGYLAKLYGRESELAVLNVDEPQFSNTYNPILFGDADEVSSRLLNLIPSSENNPATDFYRQSANHALSALVGGLRAANLVWDFNDLTVLTQSAAALEDVVRRVPPGAERMALEVFVDKYRRFDQRQGAIVDINKLKDTLGGISGRMALFAQGKFGQIFNTYAPQVNLYDIIVNNKMLYIMLPTMGKNTQALNFAKMLLSDLMSAVAMVQGLPKSQRPWPPFLVFADEMGSYPMEGIARLFEQARSAQIGMMPGFQSFANLTAVSDDFADMVTQSMYTKLFFHFGAKDSAEMAAEIIGKEKKMQYSVTSNKSEGASERFLQAAPDSSESATGAVGESWREAEEYRVSPDKLTALVPGESIVLIGNRLYHMVTPRITTPVDTAEPDSQERRDLTFKPLQFRTQIEDGKRGLNFAETYGKYLMGGET